jgi:hypothetical protein
MKVNSISGFTGLPDQTFGALPRRAVDDTPPMSLATCAGQTGGDIEKGNHE